MLMAERGIPPTQLSYFELQKLRQYNIHQAVSDPDATVEKLVKLFRVAKDGFLLAVHYDAVESDAQTFLNLQEEIRDRLRRAPSDEIIRVLGDTATLSDLPPVE